MAGRRAGFTTRASCLLAAGVTAMLCGLVLGEIDLLRAGVLAAAIPCAAALLVHRARIQVANRRSLDPQQAVAGDSVTVNLTITNRARLPTGALMLEDKLPTRMTGRARFVLDSLAGHQAGTVSYRLPALGRGQYRVGPLRIRLADPFHMIDLTRSFTATDEFVVTPRVDTLTARELPRSDDAGDSAGSHSVGSYGADDASTREYRTGDDLRKIHWRSSARTGQLMVRQEERPWRSSATVLLDLRADAHDESPSSLGPPDPDPRVDSSLEWAVSAAASIGTQAMRSGREVGLITDPDQRERLRFSGAGHLAAHLAGVRETGRRSLVPFGGLIRTAARESALIAILGRLDPDDLQLLADAQPRGGPATAFAIVLDVDSWLGTHRPPGRRSPAEAAAAVLQASGWRVSVVTRGMSNAHAFSVLMAANGLGAAATGPRFEGRADELGDDVTRETGGAGAKATDPNSVRRTLLALLATGLGIVPLKGLFSDNGWLIDVWLTMIIVLGPAALLRRRRPPGALDIWPGIVLMIPWLTLRFVRTHAIAGVLPGPATWHDVSMLLVDLHKTTRDDVAPIHTTVAVRLVICALLGLVAALVDLVAVVGRRGALAGVPLLVVYTVAGAVPRHPVSWVWFAFAAAGFLILLGLDSEDVLASWGRRIRPPKGSRGPNAVSVTTPRIAIVAVVVAIALPLLVPAQSRNLISDAFHDSGGGSGGIGGFGGGSAGSIAPFAQLKGQLDQKNPVTLMKVQMQGSDDLEPFYLRVNVLDHYTSEGFQVSDHGETDQIASDGQPDGSRGGGFPFATEPGGTGTAVQLKAQISLTDQVRGNAPVFAVPSSVTGLSSSASWDPQDQILLGQQITGSTDYTETFDQPTPTAAQLAAAGDSVDDPSLGRYLDTSNAVPSSVVQQVEKITRGAKSLYARALAINDYFTDPASGFIYSLQTKPSDSGNALANFLKYKQGYCQQYAAAEAVMLRAVGVPSRVVLGYMHTATGSDKSFSVTTTDAHAWVEAYFPGQGWIPFDPTPSAGLAGNSKTDLPWARHADQSTGTSKDSGQPSISRSNSSGPTAPTSSAPSTQPNVAGSANSSPTSLTPLWWTLAGLVVVALVLSPTATRGWRRRSRFAAARRLGDAGALWAELSDTVVDLGYPWSPARTPRQVAGWLSRDAPASATWLSSLAEAVERQRYSRNGRGGADTAALAADARSALGELGSGRTRPARLRAAFWPASLRWSRFLRPGWFARRGA